MSLSPSSEDRRETLAIVIPLYNEQEVVPTLIEALESFRSGCPDVVEIILVDDGSGDRTAELVRSLTGGLRGYRLLRFSRNFGHQLAITAGLSQVQADAAVVMDADLQDPLEVVVEMVRLWREGYDVVYGVRRERLGETRSKRLLAALYYRFFRWMTEIDMPPDAGDFRLMARPVLDAFGRLGEQHPYVRGLVAWLGFKQIGVPYVREARVAGVSKYPLRKLLKLATRSLTSFSDKPLRLAAWLGLLTAALSLVGLVWVLLANYVFGAAMAGWAPLAAIGFFLGGLHLFFLGVVGMYLVRVYDEVRGRPRYVVREVWQSPLPVSTYGSEEAASGSTPAP